MNIKSERLNAALDIFRAIWGRDGGPVVRQEIARYLAYGWGPQAAAEQAALDMDGGAYA